MSFTNYLRQLTGLLAKCELCGDELPHGGFLVPRFWEEDYSTNLTDYVDICKSCLEAKLTRPQRRIGPSETKEVLDDDEEARATI